MHLALLLGFVAFTLLAVLLVWSRTRIELARSRLRQLEDEALSYLPEGETHGA
jgi:heme exporter protein C